MAQNFGWSSIAQRLTGLFEQVIAGREPALNQAIGLPASVDRDLRGVQPNPASPLMTETDSLWRTTIHIILPTHTGCCLLMLPGAMGWSLPVLR